MLILLCPRAVYLYVVRMSNNNITFICICISQCRFMADIFTMLIQQKEDSEKAVLKSPGGGNNNGSGEDSLIDFSLSASFLEVYGEDIHDLLDEDRKSLPIREDSNGEVIVKGLITTPIASGAEAMNVLNTGTMNRTTASTLMNLTSSRSHAVFTVNLHQTRRSSEGVDMTTSSRFTFVDLAGSERMKKTGAEGARAREGIKINEGLLALGNVINALADEEKLAKGEKVHVPYRQSKLTRLLQDALGGNSQTLFMACVSPSDTNASETLSTLQYANRARNIKNALTRNVDANAVELQRLRTLTNLLKCELVKKCFAGVKPRANECVGNSQEIGVVDEELLQRDDVKAYMNQIEEKLSELSGGSTSNLTMSFPTHSVPSNHPAPRQSVIPPSSFTSTTITDINGRQSIQPPSMNGVRDSIAGSLQLDGDEDALIEEDMQIIDQLLELQQQDKKFKDGQKDDQDKIQDMDGEIATQEGRLLQLREHLKVYHSMKDKYERLMCEVNSLESEKQSLANQLDKAQVDPTKGCSRAIKAKLQQVEEGLARARSDARKHQQMYRQAEQEAQKCKVLERKIQDLKHAKVNMIKKQREDALKHKEFTTQKTREIQALKRKERTADKKISKMEMEVTKYKNNLERSRSHCDKLSDKLKQTETHLMRLLTKRRNSTKISRRSKVTDSPQYNLDGMDQFAPINEEVKSIKFLLEKTIKDKVNFSLNKQAYESMAIEHGEMIQAMAKEARKIRELRRQYQAADSNSVDEIATDIRDLEETVQAFQLQIELAENDMEQMKAKFPDIEDHVFQDDDDALEEDEGPALKMITKLEGPVLRTLLWNLLESFVATELQRQIAKDVLNRKNSLLDSLEHENSIQNERIEVLTKSLDRRRKLRTSDGHEVDPVAMIEGLEEEAQAAKAQLDLVLAEKASLSTELENTQRALSMSQVAHAQVEERLALHHSQQKLTESTELTEQMLMNLQDVLAAIGMSMQDRENVRIRLENCVEDACSRMLDEATTLRDEKVQQVEDQRHKLVEMYAALGIVSSDNHMHTSEASLNDQIQTITRQIDLIRPQYQDALGRFNKLASDAEALTSAIGGDVSDHLQQLLNHRKSGSNNSNRRASQLAAHSRTSMDVSKKSRAELFKDVESMMKGLTTIDENESEVVDTLDREKQPQEQCGTGIYSFAPGALSVSFLDSCEQEIKKLRLVKSERLLSNVETCDKIRSITKQMHIGSNELSSIVCHSLKIHKNNWDESSASKVYDAIFKKGSVLVNEIFTKHLNIVLDTIHLVSHDRQLLSDTLANVISECHTALIATAQGCGMDVGDLATSLHDALLNLPPLSKEYVRACIDEMEMLGQACDTISQSEVETLTVLWEGLNLSSNKRGRFWAELDQQTSQIEMNTSSPFDSVLDECSTGVEEWVLKSCKHATRVQRCLGVRVFKLNKIHEEVERLKQKQDAKNRIMRLNNELNILDARLVEFEEKASDKQRLLNKKVNSSSLLEEERFRKQHQSLFTTKLEALRKNLNEWESNEGRIEDDDMLSEVVKSMLKNSHRMDDWMSEKTSLMHLRTTGNIKSRHLSAGKSERTSSKSTRPLSGTGRVRASSASTRRSTLKPNTETTSNTRFSSAPTTNRRQTSQRTARPLRSTIEGQRSSRPSKSSPPPRPKHQIQPASTTSSELQKRKALSASTHNASSHPKKNTTKRPPSVEVSEDVPLVLPFGDLLAETPTQKENAHNF